MSKKYEISRKKYNGGGVLEDRVQVNGDGVNVTTDGILSIYKTGEGTVAAFGKGEWISIVEKSE